MLRQDGLPFEAQTDYQIEIDSAHWTRCVADLKATIGRELEPAVRHYTAWEPTENGLKVELRGVPKLLDVLHQCEESFAPVSEHGRAVDENRARQDRDYRRDPYQIIIDIIRVGKSSTHDTLAQ